MSMENSVRCWVAARPTHTISFRQTSVCPVLGNGQAAAQATTAPSALASHPISPSVGVGRLLLSCRESEVACLSRAHAGFRGSDLVWSALPKVVEGATRGAHEASLQRQKQSLVAAKQAPVMSDHWPQARLEVDEDAGQDGRHG